LVKIIRRTFEVLYIAKVISAVLSKLKVDHMTSVHQSQQLFYQFPINQSFQLFYRLYFTQSQQLFYQFPINQSFQLYFNCSINFLLTNHNSCFILCKCLIQDFLSLCCFIVIYLDADYMMSGNHS